MAKIGTRSATIAPTVMAALFLSACGLKDDLYIPSDETQAAPTETQATEEPGAGDSGAQATHPDDENGPDAPDRLPAPAP